MSITPETLIKKSVQDWLNEVKYSSNLGYVPSIFALNYINFIKLVNGDIPEPNRTPIVHMQMLDNLAGSDKRLANLCTRGFGKTVLFAEYLIPYIAIFGGIEGFGDITGIIYLSDSMENGVKNLRKNIEDKYEKSEFLQEYLPTVRFTDPRIDFINKDGHKCGVKLFGAKTGIRGTKLYGQRPVLAILDDLVSDADANSVTILRSIKDTIYRGVFPALDPTRSKIVFSGTPFNQNDPLYQAIESGAWVSNVYPVCEEFPCSKEDFVGAWSDRFSYEYVKDQYDTAVLLGEVASFNQEYMLRINSAEDRIIQDSDIGWYNRGTLLTNLNAFNIYITTDFATSESNTADLSIISVWAINNIGQCFLIDGIAKRQLMDANIDELFTFCQKYTPQSVGIEVSGQQGGFISWLQTEMMSRNIFFPLASDSNNGNPGIRPTTRKLTRFLVVQPWFKQNKVLFPEEWKDTHPLVIEAINELENVTMEGFKSRYDDWSDTMSMLSVMPIWYPSAEALGGKRPDGVYEHDDDEDDLYERINSYVV